MIVAMLGAVDIETVTILLSACGTLGGAVAFLYKQQSAFHKDTSTKLAECEKDRIVLHEQQSKLWAELARQAGTKLDELKARISEK